MIRPTLRSGLTFAFLLLSTLSIAAAPDGKGGSIEGTHLARVLKLDGEIFHVQGLELEERRIWVTSVDGAGRRAFLHEFDRASGRALRRLELTDGARYHPGGISISGRSIWVPVAEMKPDSSAVLVEIDRGSLAVRRKIHVADHLGCVAVSDRGDLVAGNWDSRQFHVFDLKSGAPVRIVQNPTQTRYQDIKFVGNQLVAGGALSLWDGSVDWIDWPSMSVTRTLRAGSIGPVRPFGRGGPLTGEGMAIEARDLYVIPEDGPSRLFHFVLNEDAAA